MAGIPLTSGFTGKWAVFEVALAAGAWPVVIVAVLASAAAAYFYVRVIVVMYFHEPDGRRRLRRAPVGADRDRDRRSAPPRRSCWASCPGPVLDLAADCGTIHQVTRPGASGDAGLAMPVLDEALAAGSPSGWQEVEKALAATSGAGRRSSPSAASHLMEAGGKRFRPLLVLLAAETGRHPDVGRRDHRRLRGRADPPRLALPRRRDGRGRAAPRRRVGQRPLGQPRRDPHRRLPVLEVLGADRRARRRTPYGSRRRPSPGSSRARSWRPSKPGPGDDPLEHYLDVVAGKTGSLIATSARYGARFGGATPEVEEALTAYGEIVGTAFQLSDDILDVASDSVESGKTPGTDLREGVPTLPVLMAQASDPPGGRPAARAARRRPHRRRPPRRGARAAARAPGDGRGPRLRRRPRPARPRPCSTACPTGPVRDRARGLRRHRRHPLHLTADPAEVNAPTEADPAEVNASEAAAPKVISFPSGPGGSWPFPMLLVRCFGQEPPVSPRKR